MIFKIIALNSHFMRWLLLLVLSNSVLAIDNINLKLGSIAGIAWQVADVSTYLNLSETIALELNIGTLTLSILEKPLQNIRLRCKTIEHNAVQIVCPNAKLYVAWKLLDEPDVDLSFTYQIASQTIYLTLSQLSIADGKVFLQAKLTPTGWQVSLNFKQVVLEKLLTKLSSFIDLPDNLDVKGKLNIIVKAVGDDVSFQQAIITGQSNNLNFTVDNNIGQNIAVKLASTITNIVDIDSNIQLIGDLSISRGNFLIDPIYTEISPDKPVVMVVDLAWQPPQLNLNSFTYNHTEITTLTANGNFNLGEQFDINKLAVQSISTQLQSFYTQYLQTWLDNEFDIKQLDFTGLLQAALNWESNQQHVIVKLANVHEANFGIAGLQGKVQWHSNNELPSDLSWSQISTNGIQLGASQVKFSLTNENIKLLEPWRQPIYDGAINIKQFQLTNLATEKLIWQLQGIELQPISIANLHTSMADLPGNIHGIIPAITYQNQQLKVTGTLQADIFDGNIIMDGANMENSEVPKLMTNIAINRINLHSLTSQMTNFGEIQGLLSGYVNDLKLVNWNPVAFDAFLGTPADDDLSHKVSQKAVKALSSLGGGTAVDAMSRSILSVFENFYYHKIGWGCQLRKDVCKMRGVEAISTESYYIIKGRLLPRIDVIGYETNVDWKVLGSRVETIINASSNASDPIIE